MKKNIALIYGGNSAEAEISIKSGLNVLKQLDNTEYNIYQILLRGSSWRVLNPDGLSINQQVPFNLLQYFISLEEQLNKPIGKLKLSDINTCVGCEIDKTDFSFSFNGEKVCLNQAVIMIHGTPGENGMLQGYFEMLDIPFNTCSSFVSAITFDKHSCKRFLDNSGVKMAKDVYLIKGANYCQDKIIESLGLPVFVKPTNGGSSFGVTKVKEKKDLKAAIDFVFEEYDSALIESFIKGRELTNGIYIKDDIATYFPVTEIITTREFFDYEAKYLGESKEICPAQVSDELTKEIQLLSEKIYRYLGCTGLVRVDYILKDNDLYFLELNTVPGMTQMSLIPVQARVGNIDLNSIILS